MTEYWRWPLYDKKIVDVVITGGKPTRADLDLIRDYLGIMDDIFVSSEPITPESPVEQHDEDPS